MLYSEKLKFIEDDIVPVGIFDDGREDKYHKEMGEVWETVGTSGMF
jgi:ABC-type Fe3+-citrate transport system substrate-binding protein